MRIGLVHPGSMGVTVGRAAAGRAEVLWAGEGRSDVTKARADGAGFTDHGTVAELAGKSDVIISLVPPAAAEECARTVAATGFTGIYVDANAVAPERAHVLAAIVAPAEFVDGGVVGPPALEAGTTRLYLSGPKADVVAHLFGGSLVEAIVIGPRVGSASALKMAYAAYTKGSTALVMAVRALAEHHGLTDVLLDEWRQSLPHLVEQSDAMLGRSPRKAWRFTGEMHEIADTFRAAGLPGEFHDAAAEIYRRIGPEGTETDPDHVLSRIRDGGRPR